MKNKEIKSALDYYDVKLPDEDKIESTVLNVINSQRTVKTPELSFKRIIISQISSVKNSFWFFSFLFLIVIVFMYFKIDSEYTTLFLFSTTPFLNIIALPTLFFTFNRERMELEGTCLIKPATVFSAKSVICGVLDLILILFAVLISAIVTDVPVLQSAFLGFLGYTSSAFIAMCFSLFFKTQVAMAVTSAIYAVAVSSVFVFEDVANFILNMNFATLSIIIFLFFLLLSGVVYYTKNNYKYERVVFLYGTENI